VDKVPVSEVKIVEMIVGSQVQSALEELYRAVTRPRACPALAAVQA
jgi:hypothetical protein